RIKLATGGQMVYDRGDEVVIAPATQEADLPVCPLVACQLLADEIGELQLGQGRGDLERSIEPDIPRDDLEELFERVEPDRTQHHTDVVGRVRNIPHWVRVPIPAAVRFLLTRPQSTQCCSSATFFS